jgi:GYF domain 2
MNRIWFVLIKGKQEGPFSYEELQNDDRLTPDNFVWKQGFDDWKRIRDVPELKELFKDKPEETEQEDEENIVFKKKPPQDELVMDLGEEPPIFLWILLVLITLIYIIIHLHNK